MRGYFQVFLASLATYAIALFLLGLLAALIGDWSRAEAVSDGSLLPAVWLLASLGIRLGTGGWWPHDWFRLILQGIPVQALLTGLLLFWPLLRPASRRTTRVAMTVAYLGSIALLIPYCSRRTCESFEDLVVPLLVIPHALAIYVVYRVRKWVVSENAVAGIRYGLVTAVITSMFGFILPAF